MASTQQAIIDSIYGKLSSVSALSTAFIRDTLNAQDVEFPLVNFSVVSDPVQQYFTGDSVRMDFQVDFYNAMNSGTKATRDLADATFAALHRASLTASGYTGVSVLCLDRGNTQEDFIQGGRTQLDAWRITQQYRLWATAT